MASIQTPAFESSEFAPNHHTAIVMADEFEQIRLVGITYEHETPSIRFEDLDAQIEAFKPQVAFADSVSFSYDCEYHFAVNRNTNFVRLLDEGRNLEYCYVENIKDLPHDAYAVYSVKTPKDESTNTITLELKTRAVYRDAETGAITGYGFENAGSVFVKFTDTIETNHNKTVIAVQEALETTDQYKMTNRFVQVTDPSVTIRGGVNPDSKVYAINPDGTLKERIGVGTQLYVFRCTSYTVSNNDLKPNEVEEALRVIPSIPDNMKEMADEEYDESLDRFKGSEDYEDIKKWAERIIGNADSGMTPPTPDTGVYNEGEPFVVKTNEDMENLDTPITINIH